MTDEEALRREQDRNLDRWAHTPAWSAKETPTKRWHSPVVAGAVNRTIREEGPTFLLDGLNIIGRHPKVGDDPAEAALALRLLATLPELERGRFVSKRGRPAALHRPICWAYRAIREAAHAWTRGHRKAAQQIVSCYRAELDSRAEDVAHLMAQAEQFSAATLSRPAIRARVFDTLALYGNAVASRDLFIQFAGASPAWRAQLRACAACRALFLAARMDATTCSPRCRQRRSRTR